MKITHLFFFVVLLVSISSCSTKLAPLQSTMHTEGMHHKWMITAMKDQPSSLGYMFIDVRDVEQSGGASGCDSFSFTPKYAQGNRVDFMHLKKTAARCKGSTLEDKIFSDNLRQVYYFQRLEKELLLLDKNRQTLFTAVIDTTDENGSIQRKWYCTTMLNAKTKDFKRIKPYIDFTDINNATAYWGCNRFSFSAIVQPPHFISLSAAASTRMYCETAAANEAVFIKVIPVVKMYQIIGNTLRLFDKDNTLLIEAIAPLQ